MKTVKSEGSGLVLFWSLRVGVLSFLSLLLLGTGISATSAPLMQCSVPAPPESLRLQVGTVALAPPSQPAAFSFQRADGQIETAGDLAGVAAANVLNTTVIDPLLNWPWSAITFAAAPFAAAHAALDSRARLTPDKLAECEADLLKAMREMAAQQQFHDCLLKSASERCPGRLTFSGQMGPPLLSRDADSILHARVEELHLDRTGSGDASYALHIKVRVRLVRTGDDAVLYDQSADFRSGTCLFLDWTLPGAFQGVAETGYRQLADRIVDRLLATTDKPLLVGAGFKKPNTPHRKAPVTPMKLAGTDSTTSPAPGGTTAASWNESLLSSWANGPEPPFLPVAYMLPVADREAPVEIYSSTTIPHVTFQKPLTRDEAVSQAMRETDWAVGGLENHNNQIISVAAIAIAVPIGLWKQSAAIARGLSAGRVRQTEVKLSEAANQAQPQEGLAFQVAQQLAPRTSQPVMLASLSSSDRQRATTLEIHVQRASLTGEGDINPKLALSIEAQATLRSRDGRQLYSCPVKYRSEPLRFTEWASHNARPFREELQHCYRAMSAALVDQMVRRGLVPPGHQPQTTLAKN